MKQNLATASRQEDCPYDYEEDDQVDREEGHTESGEAEADADTQCFARRLLRKAAR